jgi:hypothetical protein
MLSNLQEMTVLGPEAGCSLHLSKSSLTRAYPAKDGDLPASPRDIRGKIESEPVTWIFAGQELAVKSLRVLREHRHWPTSLEVDLNENRSVKDKSLPHAAAALQMREHTEAQGKLTIAWAVFLPIGDVEETIRVSDGASFQLTLHGYFFLKPDRTSILPWTTEDLTRSPARLEDELSLQRHWNAQLATQGTLRTVLPALATFEQELRGSSAHATSSHKQVQSLMRALQASSFFRTHREAITAEHQWLSRLMATRASNSSGLADS